MWKSLYRNECAQRGLCVLVGTLSDGRRCLRANAARRSAFSLHIDLCPMSARRGGGCQAGTSGSWARGAHARGSSIRPESEIAVRLDSPPSVGRPVPRRVNDEVGAASARVVELVCDSRARQVREGMRPVAADSDGPYQTNERRPGSLLILVNCRRPSPNIRDTMRMDVERIGDSIGTSGSREGLAASW